MSKKKHAPSPLTPPPRPFSLALVGLTGLTAVLPLVAGQIAIVGSGSDYSAGNFTLAGLLVLATFCAALIDAARARRLSIPRSPLLLGAGLLALAAILAATRAADPYDALLGAAQVVLGVLYLLTVLLVVDSREKAVWLVAALVAGAAAAAATGLLNRVTTPPSALMAYFQQYRLEELNARGITPGSPEEAQFKIRIAGDFVGTFAHPNVYAAYMATAAVVMLALLAGLWRRWRQELPRALAALALATDLCLCAAVIVLSRGRAAAIGCAVGIYLLVVMLRVERPRRRAILYALPLVAAVVAAAFVWHTAWFQAATISLKFRGDYWAASWAMIRDHWLWGVGPENFGRYYLQYKLPTAPEEIHDPHNVIVWAWSEFGLLGLTGLAALAVAAAREMVRRGQELAPLAARSENALAALRSWRMRTGLAVAVVAIVAALALQGEDSWGEATIVTLMGLAFGIGVMAAGFMAALVTGLASEPAPGGRDALRCGLKAALVVLGLQMLVSTDYSQWPSALAALLLLGLLAATGTGRPRWQLSLDHPGRRALAGLAAATLLAGYGGLIAWPVASSDTELLTAKRYLKVSEAYRTGQEYRAALTRAEAVCPWWAEPHRLMAESDWYRMMAVTDRAAGRNWLEQASQELAAASQFDPRNVDTLRRRRQVEAALADQYGDQAARDAAVARTRQVLELYPTNALFRAEAAELFARYGRSTEAAAEARRALELDDLMPDPTRKLSTDERANCEKLKTVSR
jgi:O-antigen ligase/tetratricopeptide (TPR) repeat protein